MENNTPERRAAERDARLAEERSRQEAKNAAAEEANRKKREAEDKLYIANNQSAPRLSKDEGEQLAIAWLEKQYYQPEVIEASFHTTTPGYYLCTIAFWGKNAFGGPVRDFILMRYWHNGSEWEIHASPSNSDIRRALIEAGAM